MGDNQSSWISDNNQEKSSKNGDGNVEKQEQQQTNPRNEERQNQQKETNQQKKDEKQDDSNWMDAENQDKKKDTRGEVRGDVRGDTKGDARGEVRGDTRGEVRGDVRGDRGGRGQNRGDREDRGDRGDRGDDRGGFRRDRNQNRGYGGYGGGNRGGYQGRNRQNRQQQNGEENKTQDYVYRKRNRQNEDGNQDRGNNRYQNRDNNRNYNRYNNNGNNYRNPERNSNNERNQEQDKNKNESKKPDYSTPQLVNPNIITAPYESITIKGIELRLSYKKILSQYHNYVIVPFEDESLRISIASSINNLNNDVITKRLQKKKEVWQGKEGQVIDLKYKTSHFDAIFLLKLPNLEKGLNFLVTMLKQIGETFESIAFPFLGNDEDIDETSKIMVNFLFDKIQKWQKGKPKLVSIIAEHPEHYLSLKKAFHANIEKLMEMNKIQIA